MNRQTSIILALDLKSSARAKALVRRLGPMADFYKLPPALVLRDPSLVRWLRARGKKVFLDCKWYDIPSQVRRSVEAAGRLGVTACTVHLGGGREMLKAALAARPRPKIWGVSVLTSFTDRDLKETGVRGGVRAQVLRLAKLARSVGLDGIVCSPRELRMLRPKTTLKLITPGIRFGKIAGKDQSRTATPREAWDAGADYVVIGRAVLESKDPRGTVRRILASAR